MVYFKLMVSELGVYINEKADPKVIENGKALASMVPGVKPQPICFPFRFEREIPERIIVVGGEASNRTVMQELYNRDERQPVVTMGGGTNNVSRSDLLGRRITTTFEELMDIKIYQFANLALY